MNGPRFLGCLTAWLVIAAAAPAAPVIRLSAGKGPTTVEVTGLSREALGGLARWSASDKKWGKVLSVYVDTGKPRTDQPAVLGEHRVDKGVLRFAPRFPLTPGVRYRVVLDPAGLPGSTGGKVREEVLSLPKPQRKPTAVVSAVYPSTDRLPENQLKFYLHFSAAMRQGDSYRHIKLLDGKGKALDLPFLELDQELWDPAGRRFTLFIDPGRIKRGLKPREELGPVLEQGKRYTLVIDRAWRDAEGAPLRQSFRKSFRVGPPDETPPDPKTWKLQPPAGATRAPLRVTFPKPMDHGLLHRLVWVTDPAGKKVPGRVEVGKQETLWSFTPGKPWQAGAYHLVADTRLEDLAGNGIGRPFEVDVLRPVERQVKTQTVRVGFEVKGAAGQ